MNEINTETFIIIFKPIFISALIGSIFFVCGIQSIIKYRLMTIGIFGYIMASIIMYVGLIKMEEELINTGIITTRIYISELLLIFYLGLLIYILLKTKKVNLNDNS